jgi:NADPH2:quinone reductase
MVSFGQSSGAIGLVNLGILARKASLYVTRPLCEPMRLRANRLTIAQDLIDVALSGAFKIKVNQTYPLRDAIKAHQNLQARKTTGSIV